MVSYSDEKSEIDLKPILINLKPLFSNFAVIFYRKSDLSDLKVISIISKPDFEAIFKSEDFIEWDSLINDVNWHDYHYLLYKDFVCQKEGEYELFFEKYFDLDADCNLVPKFKGFFEMLKETSELAKQDGLNRGIEKWRL
jgi:hypothetical protein